MRVMVFAAHPDDEIIGVSGTLYKHVQRGDSVRVIIVCEGKSSRLENYRDFKKEILSEYQEETHNALSVLNIHDYRMLALANNRLDMYDFLDVVKIISKEVDEYHPDVIYTHYHKEMNIDHNIVSRAVLTACRPLPGSKVKEVCMYETLSSTEYAAALGETFCPNMFVDISEQLERKLLAMKCYISELREAPHPRNIDSIKQNAQLWGAKIGVPAAEAFVIARIIK